MVKLGAVIVVEGRYDKNKVSQIFDTEVIEVGGFGVFNDEKMLRFLGDVAKTRGIVVLTDPDGAGLVIRNRIKQAAQGGRVYNAYVPDVLGKERRKTQPSKEGKLGVEGMDDAVLIAAVQNSGAMAEQPQEPLLTKQDMYALGLSGGENSRKKRAELIKKLSLPENISANALLDAINALSENSGIRKIIEEMLLCRE